jgi:hypothetical protein
METLKKNIISFANVACLATLEIANVAWLGTLAFGTIFFFQYHISFH